MVDLQHLQRSWNAIETTPFPMGCRGKTVNGVELTSVQSEAGGLILAYIHTGGSYGSRQLYYVRQIRDQLSRAVAGLESPAKEYFERILHLLDEIIAELPESEER